MREKLFRIYNRAMQQGSNILFRSVLSTGPIPVHPGAPTVIYTILNRSCCRAYLVGIKSLLRFCPPVDVAIQSDGTLTAAQIAELKAHLPGCSVYSERDMDETVLERIPASTLAAFPPLDECNFFVKTKLLTPLCRFQGRHVVLFDSDILCLRRPDFLIDWMTRRPGHDWYGGGGSHITEAFQRMGFGGRDVKVGNFNAGFIGIGNTYSWDLIEDVARRIRTANEALFRNWEIEQSIWAVLFDTQSGAVNVDGLGTPYVGSGWRTFRDLSDNAVFAHFVGAIRFKNLRYLRLAYRVLRELRSTGCASLVAADTMSTS